MARNRVEAVLQSAFDDVFQMDDAQDAVLFGNDQGRPAGAGDVFHRLRDVCGKSRPVNSLMASGAPLRICRPSISTPLIRVWAEKGDERGMGHLGDGAAPQAILLGQDDDAPSLRRLVGQGRQLRRIGQFLRRHAGGGDKFRGLAVAEGDGAGLVQQQDVHIPGRLDGPAAHGQDVLLDQPVDARNADGAQEPADRRGNQADQKGDKDGHGKGDARIEAEEFQGQDDDQKDDRQGRKEDGQGDFVGGFLALRPFHQADHPVHESFPRDWPSPRP